MPEPVPAASRAVLVGLADAVIATEIDPRLAAAVAGVAPNVDALRVSGSSCAIPLRDGIADGVVCVEVPDLTHWRWFYRESRRLLRPGGVLIVTLQNRLSWKGVVARMLRRRYRTKLGPAYYRRSLRELVSLARQAGFDVEDAVGFNWLPFSRTSDSPLVPALAKLEKALRLDRLVRDQPLGHRPVSRGGRARRPGRPPALVQPRPPSGVQEGVAWSADVRHHG